MFTNAVVPWNAVYMSAVLDQLRTAGHNVDEREISDDSLGLIDKP